MVKVNSTFSKANYDIEDLLRIMKILRSENGCPWDREQNHKSIRNDLIEEAYEVADAIDKSDDVALKEELGDLLLQVVFHSRIAEECDSFDFNGVADGICKKLIYRHPHVFSDVVAETSKEVLDNWDKLKKSEKNMQTFTDTLRAVPETFPALMRAQKVQKRADKAGYDFENVSYAIGKAEEELSELKAAVENGDCENIAEEFGDLLFSAVNISRFIKCDSEYSLKTATDKFISRFERAEKAAAKKGKKLDSLSAEELDFLWNEAKNI